MNAMKKLEISMITVIGGRTFLSIGLRPTSFQINGLHNISDTRMILQIIHIKKGKVGIMFYISTLTFSDKGTEQLLLHRL